MELTTVSTRQLMDFSNGNWTRELAGQRQCVYSLYSRLETEPLH
jgi:hypothetical protein